MDVAVSGKKPMKEREAGKIMLFNARAGDSIVMSKLDRGFRNAADCLNTIDECQRRNLKLHILNIAGGHAELTNIFSKAMIQIMAVFAELDRAMIAERIREAAAERKRQGRLVNSQPPLGFKVEARKVKDGNGGWVVHKYLVKDEAERKLMKDIFDLRFMDPPPSVLQAQIYVNNVLGYRTRGGNRFNERSIIRYTQREARLQYLEMLERKAKEESNENV
jgi:DNA invertase Pin-like site-specific DNA recombinase